MKYLRILALLVAIALTGSAFYYADASSLPVGGTQYYLSGAGITSTATTIQLTSFKTPDGRNITMSNFGTVGYAALDPQTTTKLENITFTGITQNGNGTAILTGVSRGLDFVYPYTASTTLARSHSGGATLILTNTAGFYYAEFAMPTNANVNIWPFASTSPATKGYVDFVAFNGAAVINANTTNKGIVQIATGLQAASSTSIGSTAAVVVLPASLATSTWSATVPVGTIPAIGSIGGKIDSGFIGSLASSTVIGSTYAFDIGQHEQVFTASSTWLVPNGIHTVWVRLAGGGGASGARCTGACGSSGGGAGGYAEAMIDVSATTSIDVKVGQGGNALVNNQTIQGATGSTTSFSTFLNATGGTGGVGGGTTGAIGGGVGGYGSGVASSSGQIGGPAFSTSPTFVSGLGGLTPLGKFCGSGGDGGNNPGANGCVILIW